MLLELLSCLTTMAGLTVTAAAEDWRDPDSLGLLDVRKLVGCSLTHTQIDWHAPQGGLCCMSSCVSPFSWSFSACWEVSRAAFLLWLHKSDL